MNEHIRPLFNRMLCDLNTMKLDELVKDGTCPTCKTEQVLVKMSGEFICQECWEKDNK